MTVMQFRCNDIQQQLSGFFYTRTQQGEKRKENDQRLFGNPDQRLN